MKNKQGFTLLETLIAMVILSAGILLLTNSWSGSFLRIRKTQLSQEISALLERKMAEIDMQYQGKPLDSIPEDQEDDFGSDYPKYSWRMKSQEFQMPNLADLMMAQNAGGNGTNEMMTMVIQKLTEHLTKSVREVKVTIIYKGGKKPIEFSAVTYFVDYDRPLNFIGGSASGGQ